MNDKQKISAEDLASMIMDRVRQEPDCGHILSVGIQGPFDDSRQSSNWKAGFVHDGTLSRPLSADAIATDLQNRFDVIW